MNKIFLLLAISLAMAFHVVRSQTVGFHTDAQGRLLDDNGNEFIPRGINTPLHWFPNDVPASIASLRANTNVNALRIVVSDGSNGYGRGETPEALWKGMVEACIDNDIIPMIEIHDYTGSNNPNDLNKAAQWYVKHATYLKSANIKKHILINIANEWSSDDVAKSDATGGTSIWLNAYKTAISTIRNAGISTTLVVDAPGYAQDRYDAQNIREDGPAIMAHDATLLGGKANIMFSIHMYCLWASNFSDGPSDPAILNTIKNTLKIPIMVGEFGFEHPGSTTDGQKCNIDELYLMQQGATAGFGWFAWSQKGDDVGLDLCKDWTCSSLNSWGQTVFNSPNGTKNSETCSVFLSNNVRPTIAINSPSNNASFENPSSITITATATDADGNITKVEFFNGTTSLGSDLNSPYSITLNNPAEGNYSITAVATDNSNASTTSIPVEFAVTPLQCPVPSLGEDLFICSNSSIILDAGTSLTGVTYSWKRNNSTISGSKNTLTVTTEGTYKVITTKTGCTQTSDIVVVKSGELIVSNDTICKQGTANLAVAGGTGGTYNWYTSATSNSIIKTGTAYSPQVNNTTTYYVQEEGTTGTITRQTIGQTEQNSSASKWDITDFSTNDKQVKITVSTEITLDAISVYPSNSGTNVTIRVLNASNNQSVGSNTVNNLGTGKQRIPLNITLTPGTYILDAWGTSNKLMYDANSGSFPYSINGMVSIEGNAPWVQEQNRYGCFYAWEFSYGKLITKEVCNRVPVVAMIDPLNSKCIISSVFDTPTFNTLTAYPNPTTSSIQLEGEFDGEWYLYNMMGNFITKGQASTINMSDLPAGIYSLIAGNQTVKIIKN